MDTLTGNRLSRWSWRHTLCTGLLMLCGGALAQDFPVKPIQLIVPYPAGGTGENFLRTMGERVQKSLGQPVLIEARPGASGRLAIIAQQQARGSAYMLSLTSSANIITLPLIDTSFKAEPGKDYTPVMGTYAQVSILATNALVPFKDIRGLVAYAKANPGKLNFAHSGPGSLSHLSMEQLKSLYGLDVTYVAYKSPTQAITDMISNQVQLAFLQTTDKQHYDSGKLVPLASSGPARVTAMPNLPTLRESGFKDFDLVSSFGIAAPPDAPRDQVMKIYNAYSAPLKDEDMINRAAAIGAFITNLNPDQKMAELKADLARWGPVVRRLDIKPE